MSPLSSASSLRQSLEGRWFLARTAPGEAAPPPGDARWRAISRPGTAAAALRERGEWSLDGPALDFDAYDWWWRAEFTLKRFGPDATLGSEGIATCSEAWLNGQRLFEANSMFQPLQARVGELLREGVNELLIHCKSLNHALAGRRPRPRWRVPMLTQQQLRWFRTSLLGRTPGWSPPAAPVGPWRGVWINTEGASAEASWTLLPKLLGEDGELAVQVHSLAGCGRVASVTVVVSRGDARHEHPAQWSNDGRSLEALVPVPQVARWWPHTHGEPALYEVSLVLRGSDGERQELALGRVGFREIVADTEGGRFSLRVNGQPVFCRGACWTPLDAASLSATPEALREAIAQVREAGMNMIRVPGTTVYEEDAFHTACDEAGVMVWQDFMFASMDYPAEDAAFAAGALDEVRGQLRRLRNHPSTAVLCGNSEVSQQAAMWGAPRELWHPAFFHQQLPEACAQEAPGIPYWPSSAHGGDFPHQADQGTTSYYGVGAYQRPLDDARHSRVAFATECLAFANVPEPATLARLPGGLATRSHHPGWKQRSPRDLGAGWDFDDVRDHYLGRLFGVEPEQLRRVDHERYLALSRIATGETMAAAFGQWRRAGSGCGGALVLSLRDLWAGAGWGLLDDRGLPKACWWALRRVLQPVAVWLTDEGMNGIACQLANDTPQPREAVLEISAWRGGEVRALHASRPLTLAAHSVQRIACEALFDTLPDLGWTWRFGPPTCEALVARLVDAQGETISQAFHFPLGLGLPVEGDLGLQAQVHPRGEHEADLVLTTRRLALGVQLDVRGWQADDDHFHMAPGQERRVRLSRRADARAGSTPEGTVQAVNGRVAAPLLVANTGR